METKTCKECGRELPVTEFMLTRWEHYTDVCKGCIKDKKKNAFFRRVIVKGEQNAACPDYSDPDFDGKQPVEVIQLMKRAKMWLEAQGYNITLKGTYTQVREVKF